MLTGPRGFFNVFNHNVSDMDKISNNTPNVNPPELIPSGIYYNVEPGFNDGPLPTREELRENLKTSGNVDSFDFGLNSFLPSQADRQPPSYLDTYACNGGVETEAWPLGCYRSELEDKNVDVDFEREKIRREKELWEINREFDRLRFCGRSASISEGEITGDRYYHKLKCKKHFCPVCGGKKGLIHQSRKAAIMKRIDLGNYDIEQLILTVPKEHRSKFMSRKGVKQLTDATNRLVKRFYDLSELGAIAYVHLFGDPSKENPDNDLEFNPHVNVHIITEKGKAHKITVESLEKIRESWKRALRGLGCEGLTKVDVHYSFRIRPEHKGHAVKYMSRPTWGMKQARCEELQPFLLLEMKGFQYLRFWGALSNRNYHEAELMTTKEEMESVEKIVGEPLHHVGYDMDVNFERMVQLGMFIEVIPGEVYKLVQKVKRC